MKGRSLLVKDIAEMAGVSVATVSRVINQNGRFSKETEERVRKIIEEYHYEPNQLARGLRTNKVQIIGVIVPDITNEFFAKIALEVQKNLFERNYSTIICNTNELDVIEKRHLSMLKSQKVSGLIYTTGSSLDHRNILDIPTVYIDRKPLFALEKTKYVLIESDNEQGGYKAAEELLEKGCRSIAIIEFKGSASTHASRLIGYKNALLEYGIQPNERLILHAKNADIESGYACTEQLVATSETFDGIFCTTDMLAIGALKALDELNINVPDQVKIVGFDDISFSKMGRLPITTVRQSVKDLGVMAANMLVDMIDGVKQEENHFIVPVKLIKRATT